MNIEKINNVIELGELIGSLVPLATYSELADWVNKNLRRFWSLIEGDTVDFYYVLHLHDAPASHYYSIPTGTVHISLSRTHSLNMEQYIPGIGWIDIDKSHSPWVFFSQVSNVLDACARPDTEARIFSREQLDVEYYSDFGSFLLKFLEKI